MVACSIATSSPWSVIVIRLTSGWSVWLTARDSMLKLRARIRLLTRFRTPGLSRTIATRTCRCFSPLPGMARGGGATCAGTAEPVTGGGAVAGGTAAGGTAAGGTAAGPEAIPFPFGFVVTPRPRPTSRSGRTDPCRPASSGRRSAPRRCRTRRGQDRPPPARLGWPRRPPPASRHGSPGSRTSRRA